MAEDGLPEKQIYLAKLDGGGEEEKAAKKIWQYHIYWNFLGRTASYYQLRLRWLVFVIKYWIFLNGTQLYNYSNHYHYIPPQKSK